MRPRQVFRFLDLPKDVRLMVYEQLPVVACHRRLRILGPDKQAVGLTIVAKTVAGSSIVYTCRTICFEAAAIFRGLISSNPAPLRLFVEASDLTTFPVEDILRCKAGARHCERGVLHNVLRFKDVPANRMIRAHYDDHIIDREISSHASLHQILGHGAKVEIGIVYHQSSVTPYLLLREFYAIIRYLSRSATAARHLDIELRPMLQLHHHIEYDSTSGPLRGSNSLQSQLQALIRQRVLDTGSWDCTVGPDLSGREWIMSWHKEALL